VRRLFVLMMLLVSIWFVLHYTFLLGNSVRGLPIVRIGASEILSLLLLKSLLNAGLVQEGAVLVLMRLQEFGSAWWDGLF
jgi:hypothetical protein